MIDWEGMIITTLYVSGCNFRCPFCYNTELVVKPHSLPVISEEKILSFLLERKPFLDGICLSGGEPTLFSDVTIFLKKIKSKNFKIKLDTNGSKPEKLREIIEQNLVDYIAMDIKNSLDIDAYIKTIGSRKEQIIDTIKKSINLVMNSGIDYEFRTTVVPGFHDTENIVNIAREIEGAQKYILQKFIQSEEMLDPCLRDVQPYSEEKMNTILKKIEPYVQECRIR
jgi:pyruvate formate lyase activating enzyme